MFRRVGVATIAVGSPLLPRSGASSFASSLPSSGAGSPCGPGGLRGSGAAAFSALRVSCAFQSSAFTGTLPPPPLPGAAPAADSAAPKKRRGRKSKKALQAEAEAARPVIAAAPLVAPAADAGRAVEAALLPPPPPPAVAEVLVDDITVNAAPPPTAKLTAKRAAKAAAAAAAIAEASAQADVVAAEEPELDELSFFANMEDSRSGTRSPHTFTESTLVYNALTGRLTSEASPTIVFLKQIGFTVNSQRQLVVGRPEEINKLAERLRAGTTSLPPRWPATLTRVLGGILANTAISDPAEAISQMMRIKLNSMMRSRYAAVVTAGGEVDVVNANGRFSALDDPVDPTKSIELNPEQERVIDIALQGHNMYIGGSAGTGKTVLLRVLHQRLQSHRLRVAMTATTGVAGCHIGGSTFHHALGVSSNGEFLRRSTILDYDVIIIDEVSMFPLRLFDNFDRVLREEAGTPDLPFGGVQIILCGDFLQLGCINEQSVIHSRLFTDTFVKLRLETIVRQSQYAKFAEDLQLMRRGIVPSDLTTTVQQLPVGTMVDSAVNLLPTNKEVLVANQRELDRLEGEPLTLTPEHGITTLKCDTTATLLLRTQPNFNEVEFTRHVRSLLQATLDFPRVSLLSLYRIYEDGHAMRVMLPPGESVAWREAMRERFLEVASLINDLELGATVTEIVPNGDGLHTPENEEYLQKLMSKHPIAQPMTFKKGCRVLLRSNLTSNLVNGSIGTVVDFVECKEENFPKHLCDERVSECIARYRVFCTTECGMPIPMVPVVAFHSGETVAVPPWEFTVGGGTSTNYYSLSSVALPLTLAYAFTVHKVQGLTLVGRVHLELSRMWPCEHLLYVAMSRVRNPEQLSMSSFTPSMVVANADCIAFDSKVPPALQVAAEGLAGFPVCAWKRCNDTIHHLRRRGSSLRRLLEDAARAPSSSATSSRTQGGSNAAGVGFVHSSIGAPRASSPASGEAIIGSSSSSSSSNQGSLLQHLASVEKSVLVARRMRKLVKHVERVAKLTEARKKAKAHATVAAAATTTAAGGDGDGSAASAGESLVTDVQSL